MDERRKFARTNVQKPARLLTEEPLSIDCLVLDLTNSGAGIRVQNLSVLPGILNLTFDAGRSQRSCRLVWRLADRIGVEFC